MNPFIADDVALLLSAVCRLLEHLAGGSHGVFLGTHQAVLVEAQGAVIIGPDGQPFSHITSMRETAVALANREGEISRALANIRAFNLEAGVRIREVLQPLLNRSAEVRAAIAETDAAARGLALRNGVRFEGVAFGQGGLGPEMGRTEASLISNQMQQLAPQLRQRGIEPSLLPPADGQGQQLLARLRDVLPVDKDDALVKLSSTITAMRIAMMRILQQVGTLVRTILAPIFTAIGEILVSIGSRLTNVIIVPDTVLQQMRRSAGLKPGEMA